MKWIRKASALLLFVCMLTPAAATLADAYAFTQVTQPQKENAIATGDEAEAIAVKALEEQGLTMDFAIDEVKSTLVKNQQGEPSWFVSIFPSESILKVHWVQVDAKTGAVLNSAIEDDDMKMLTAWQKEKGLFSFWSLEDKALFDTIFRSSVSGSINVLPQPGDIREKEALKPAQEALRASFSLTDEEISAFSVSYELWSSYENHGERVWVIGFHNLNNQENHLRYLAYVSATTGQVFNALDNNAGNG